MCLTLFVGLEFSLYAQEDASYYRGTWQIESPEQGALVLIVKRNGLASYFGAENLDLNVYQGTWSNDEDGIILQWQDGSTHRISRDMSGYIATYSDNTNIERYTVKALQLPQELLGQWAKAPSIQDEQVSNRDQAKGFFGNWKIGSETDAYYVIIRDDRSAASNWAQNTLNPYGLRGSWAKQGSELHIAWDSGHYGILRQNERSFSFKLIAPGKIIESDLSEEYSAARVDSKTLPSEWYANYTVEKKAFNSSISFIDPSKIYSFYRGTWIVQREPDAFERLEIGWFGGLKTSTDHTLQGTWRINLQDVSMRWDNGMRKILSPVGQGFVLYEYKPGRPLDGVPTRIFSATPQNAKKLAAHIEGRHTVASNLLDLAEADGMITPNTKDEGLVQGFAHWIWPFNKTPEPAEPILESNGDSPGSSDPWWWPFWSELPEDVLETKNAPETRLPSEINHSVAVSQNQTQPSKKADVPKANKSTDWEWPF